MPHKIAVLDYKIGNIRSIMNAVNLVGGTPMLLSDPNEIIKCNACILPGVGAFATGMENLKASGLIDVIHDFIATNRPFLGICLGMQMLFEYSEEFGQHAGLGLFNGGVKKVSVSPTSGERLPHVSWNEINPTFKGRWDKTILQNTSESSDVYFVHSYAGYPDQQKDILAVAEYGDMKFCAAIQKGNITGTQFHPEKSGKTGLQILKNFINNS